MPIFLCTWHVKRAWLKHLLRHVKDKKQRLKMFDRLGNILHSAAMKGGEDVPAKVKAALEGFYRTFGRYKAFIAYFKKTWEKDVEVCGISSRGGWAPGNA